MNDTSYAKVPTPSGRASSRRRRSRSRSSGDKSRRRSRSRSRRSRSSSRSPRRKAPDGFSYSKSSPYSGSVHKAYPQFDPRDQAPEDRIHGRADVMGYRGPLDSRVPLVRGSLRLEGVNFAKYEGAKSDPERQKAFTCAIRDDIISEAGNGLVREDIILRLTPGPIKTVVLDYNGPPKPDGQPGPPSLVDAEWCIDCEYAIAARDEDSQVSIARTMFETLSESDLLLSSTKAAYVRYLNPEHTDPDKIRVVPTTDGEDEQPHHRVGAYEDNDPLEGRYTWQERRSRYDLAPLASLPDAPRSPGYKSPKIERSSASIGGVMLENRPSPDPAVSNSPGQYGNPRWWDSRPDDIQHQHVPQRDRDWQQDHRGDHRHVHRN
eukprot:TRINITY_DN22624_c0_g1_i1.p1 TRINITY_DN22624_c0_g1~~TRINITY_DN22624_c0_g1_i1.p1  ORF type:complete len:377 (+),score=67.87 TRINITY_DN22624_c0_g1_i1:61-1191(+)